MKENVLQKLYRIGHEIKQLEHSIALLSWDQEIYKPEDAIEERASQLGLLETILHTKRISNDLGNLYAAQFFRSMEKELPDSAKRISQGSFEGILYWLRENIHRHGRIFNAEELCFRISGEQLNPSYFIEYLTKKYTEIYGL